MACNADHMHQAADIPNPQGETALLSTTRTETTFTGKIKEDSVVLHLQYDDSVVRGKAIFPALEDTLDLAGHLQQGSAPALSIDVIRENQLANRMKGAWQSDTKWKGEWQVFPDHKIHPVQLTSTETIYHIASETGKDAQPVSVKSKVSKMASPDTSCSLIFEYPVFGKATGKPAFHSLNKHLRPPNIRQLPMKLANCIATTTEMVAGFRRIESQSYAIHLVSSRIVSISILTTIQQGIPGQMSEEPSASVLNLNPVTAAPFQTSELFLKGYETAISDLVQTHLQNHYGKDWGIEFETIGPDQDIEIHQGQIVLRFDPGELGEFATEPIRVPVELKMIEAYLHPSGPLAALL